MGGTLQSLVPYLLGHPGTSPQVTPGDRDSGVLALTWIKASRSHAGEQFSSAALCHLWSWFVAYQLVLLSSAVQALCDDVALCAVPVHFDTVHWVQEMQHQYLVPSVEMHTGLGCFTLSLLAVCLLCRRRWCGRKCAN